MKTLELKRANLTEEMWASYKDALVVALEDAELQSFITVHELWFMCQETGVSPVHLAEEPDRYINGPYLDAGELAYWLAQQPSLDGLYLFIDGERTWAMWAFEQPDSQHYGIVLSVPSLWLEGLFLGEQTSELQTEREAGPPGDSPFNLFMFACLNAELKRRDNEGSDEQTE